MRTQRIGKGAAGRTEEGRRKGSGGAFGPAGVSGFKVPRALTRVDGRIVGDGRRRSDLRISRAVVPPSSDLGDAEGERPAQEDGADAVRGEARGQHLRGPARSLRSSSPDTEGRIASLGVWMGGVSSWLRADVGEIGL